MTLAELTHRALTDRSFRELLLSGALDAPPDHTNAVAAVLAIPHKLTRTFDNAVFSWDAAEPPVSAYPAP